MSTITKTIIKGKSNRKKYRRKQQQQQRQPRLKNTVNLGVGLPKKMLTKLTYQESRIVSDISALTSYQYCLNGLYDPYLGVGGSQPLYFDQMMALYNHYHVVGCKMTILVKPYASNTVPIKFVLSQNDDTTVGESDFNTMAEYSKSKNFMMNGQDAAKWMTLKWSAKKTFGGSVLSNNDLRGNVAGNPNEISVGQISVAPVDLLTTVSAIIQVKLEYIAMFTELKDIVGS